MDEAPLPRRKTMPALVVYPHQFKSPLVYLLLAATVASVAVGEWTDAEFIFLVLQVIAVTGGIQDWKAEHSAAVPTSSSATTISPPSSPASASARSAAGGGMVQDAQAVQAGSSFNGSASGNRPASGLALLVSLRSTSARLRSLRLASSLRRRRCAAR